MVYRLDFSTDTLATALAIFNPFTPYPTRNNPDSPIHFALLSFIDDDRLSPLERGTLAIGQLALMAISSTAFYFITALHLTHLAYNISRPIVDISMQIAFFAIAHQIVPRVDPNKTVWDILNIPDHLLHTMKESTAVGGDRYDEDAALQEALAKSLTEQ